MAASYSVRSSGHVFVTSILLSLRFGVVCVLAVCGGCVIPTYHMPAGFSSTYHDAVEKSQEAAEFVIEMPAGSAVPVEAVPKNWTSRFSRRGG